MRLFANAPLELIEALRQRLQMTQLTDAEYWRGFAKQARTEAEGKTPRSKQMMLLTLARTYDQLADAAEKKKPLKGELSGYADSILKMKTLPMLKAVQKMQLEPQFDTGHARRVGNTPRSDEGETTLRQLWDDQIWAHSAQVVSSPVLSEEVPGSIS